MRVYLVIGVDDSYPGTGPSEVVLGAYADEGRANTEVEILSRDPRTAAEFKYFVVQAFEVT